MQKAQFMNKIFSIVLLPLAILSSCKKSEPAGPEPGPDPVISGIPSVYVELTGEVIPGQKEDRLGCTVKILDQDNSEILSSAGGIRLRGNGTRYLEKSPYDLKLDKKESVLGMPKDKRWVLLANYLDRTSLRNDVGLEIARRAEGMAWNPKGEFVSLYYDGQYRGLYYLCEKIKISKDRVNIDELNADDIEEPELTGGYLLEFDNNKDEKIYWTDIFNYPVKIKEPDEVADVQAKYMIGYLNSLESVLSDDKRVAQHEYEDFIDVESFIDWWLTGEIVMCKDYNGPGSVYMYKERSGKLFAGPIWDLDLYTFSSDVHDINNFLLDGSVYYSALLKDTKFRDAVKIEWKKLKADLENGFSIYDYIDARSKLIEEEIARDDSLYPYRTYSYILSGDEYESFRTAVEMMKSFLKTRIAALDILIGKI